MTEQKMAAPKVDVTKLAEKDEHVIVKYGPLDASKQPAKSLNVTLRDPGYGVLLKIRSKQNIGDNQRDLGEMANLINENVIVNPRYAFADLDKAVSDKDKTKEVTLDGRKGKKIHAVIKFPGYREAINLMADVQGANGSDDSLGVMEVMNKDIFRAPGNPDKPLDMSFWDNGGGLQAITEAREYFNDVMNRDGYSAVLAKAVTFLQPLY